MKKFMHIKWLGVPAVAIISVVLIVTAVAATPLFLDIKSQAVTQTWTAPTPTGTVTLTNAGINLSSMNYSTSFSNVAEGTVTVTVNVVGSLEVVVTPGNYSQFGVVLTCTSTNFANISGTYWNAGSKNLEVSTLTSVDRTISFSQAGTYTFTETAEGTTGSSSSGAVGANVNFNLTNP